MLDDPGPGRFTVRIVDRRIALEIRLVQHFRFKADASVFQRSQVIVEIGIDGAGINHMICLPIQFFLHAQIIAVKMDVDTLQHFGHHFRIPAHRDALVESIEIIVIESQPHREPLDNESRQLRAGTAPLFFRIPLDELLINIRTHQRNGLLLQILRIRDARSLPLLLDLPGCFLRSHYAPHFIERIHIERQGIELTVVISHRRIRETVKSGKPLHILPHIGQIRMENMSPVLVHLDPFDGLRIHISPDMGTLVNHQTFFARIRQFPGAHSPEKPGAYYQIIVFHGQSPLLIQQTIIIIA